MDLGSLSHVLHAVGTDGTVVAQVYLLAGGEERRIQVGLVWILAKKIRQKYSPASAARYEKNSMLLEKRQLIFCPLENA